MRPDGWEQRLYESLENQGPFVWGQSDCCLFAADAVKAMTGTDPAKEFRGRYKSEKGATRILAKLGGLRKAIGSVMGEEINPLLAQRGDIVLLNNAGRGIAGVINSRGQISAKGVSGVIELPIRDAVCAWRV